MTGGGAGLKGALSAAGKSGKTASKCVNVVTPHVDAEYKVILLDKNLNRHLDSGEKHVLTDPTYIVLRATTTRSSPAYKGTGELTLSAYNVRFFLDKECKNSFPASTRITADQLKSGLKLYVRGKTAGKIDIGLQLSKSAGCEVAKPAKKRMGVVELKMVLSEQDITALDAIDVDPDTDPIATYYTNLKNKALPAQKAMSEGGKISPGRILHVQNRGRFSRAKLVCAKLDASQWPSGTDGYQVVLKAKSGSGAVALHSKEWGSAGKRLPVRIKVKDLKAGPRTFWVEGKKETGKWYDVRLDLGLDRRAGGLAKSPKRNGDWGRFTVVRIKQVKVYYKTPAGKATAWNARRGLFYINLQSDPAGRKVTVGARLSKKLKDVDIHLMLAPDKDNLKRGNWGVNLPADWKWKNVTAAVKHKDKADRKDLLHLRATTDANGVAKKELTLSRFGGDKFRPGAYLLEDPHLAKYVHGHADLGKKKPVLGTPIRVWRKFWYQVVKVGGVSFPGMGVAAGQYGRVKASMTLCPPLTITKAAAKAMRPRAIYPRYMVIVNGGDRDALVVADTNKAQFFRGFRAEGTKPMKIPILVCDAQWDAKGNTGSKSTPYAAHGTFPRDIRMGKVLLDPPLQGGTLFVSGSWEALSMDPVTGAPLYKTGNLKAANVSINKNRRHLDAVRVSLPSKAPAGWQVRIKSLVVRGAKDWLGEYDSSKKRILAVYESQDKLHRDDFQNTIAHELGHALHQVTKGNRPAGTPPHNFQYDQNGSHCRYSTNKCVMYAGGPIVGSLSRYCPECHPYLLAQDMSSWA